MSWPRRPAWTAGIMHPPPLRRAWCGPLSLPDFWTRPRRGCSPKMNLRQPCHTGGAPAGPTRWPHFERPWRGRGRASTRATPWARCYAVGRAGALWCCHAPTRRASARPDTLELIAPRREHSVNAKCVVKTAKHVWSTSKAWARRAPDLHLWGFVTTPPRGSYETTPAQVTKPPARDRMRFLAGGFAAFGGGGGLAGGGLGRRSGWRGVVRLLRAAVGAREREGRRATGVVCSGVVTRDESAAVGGPVFPTPPVAGSISSNAAGPTSIRVSGSVTSPVSLDQVSSCRRLDEVTATASRKVVLMMPT